MAQGVQVFLHLYTCRNNPVQALNLILNTAQESFLSFQLLTMALLISCPASFLLLIMCMQLEVRKMIISSEVCAMFLAQDDDLAQQ